MRFKIYPSDLTLREWQVIQPLLPRQKYGKPRSISFRLVLNAIFYLHHTGCPWRYLPKSYPHWQSVYYYFSRWSENGFWEKVCHALHEKLRGEIQKSPLPHLGIIDSQSVRAAKGEERAFDGYKRVLGRKRNIIVDTLGIIVGCVVHAADLQEGATGKRILDKLPEELEKSLEKIIGDKAYRRGFLEYAEVYHEIEVQVNDQRVTGTNMKPWSGSWREPSPGSITIEGWLEITR